MRKSAGFLIISLLASIFFSCDFSIPTAIEIRGNPSIRFAETVEIGKMFTDLLKDAINKDEKLTIIPCNRTEVVTYLIHAELLNQPFNSVGNEEEFNYFKAHFPDMTLIFSDIGLPLGGEKKLIYNTEEPLIVPLSELGSILNGFNFYDYKVKLYFSGSSGLIEKSKLNMTIYKVPADAHGKEDYIELHTEANITVGNEHSNIETWKTNGYNGVSCPTGGIDIDVPLTGNDMAISFEVFFHGDTVLHLSDFEAGNINVEVVVWLPFKFKAGAEGANLSFPEGAFFSSEDDLFGRKAAGDDSLITDVIESLSVAVKFQNSPFNGAKLGISSKGINIINPIENDTISFSITEDDMKKINNPDNYPFAPNLKIVFAADEIVSFPRIFNATEFAFNAKIRYRIDL